MTHSVAFRDSRPANSSQLRETGPDLSPSAVCSPSIEPPVPELHLCTRGANIIPLRTLYLLLLSTQLSLPPLRPKTECKSQHAELAYHIVIMAGATRIMSQRLLQLRTVAQRRTISGASRSFGTKSSSRPVAILRSAQPQPQISRSPLQWRSFSVSSPASHGHIDPPKPGEESVHLVHPLPSHD